MEPNLTATECHLPYGITQRYLPPNTSEHTRLNPCQIGRYSIYLPRRDGRLSWRRWLVSCYIPRWFTCLQTVTHPSTNRAQWRLTTLIKANALTTTLRRNHRRRQKIIHGTNPLYIFLSHLLSTPCMTVSLSFTILCCLSVISCPYCLPVACLYA